MWDGLAINLTDLGQIIPFEVVAFLPVRIVVPAFITRAACIRSGKGN